MKVLIPRTKNNHYHKVTDISKKICEKYSDESYSGKFLFHCYWHGELNEKHLSSIQSCYHYNCLGKPDREILVWVEKTTNDTILDQIQKYATVKHFDYDYEIKNTIFLNLPLDEKNVFLPYYADKIRCLLLYKYGRIWFDLDVLFLRPIDPILLEYPHEMIVYEWEEQPYPNNAIFISLQPENPKLLHVIEYIVKQNRGWGFHKKITFDLPLDFLVLPCEWFDPGWVENPLTNFDDIFLPTIKTWNHNNFFPNSFCFHWHNKWNDTIDKTSIFSQLRIPKK